MSSAASFYDDSPPPHLFERWKRLIHENPSILEYQQRLLNRSVNHSYDMPYLAGYNQKGTQIYIDKDVPFIVKLGGKSVCIRDFLRVHEATEKALIEKLHLSYEESHHIATAVEYQQVKEAGLSVDSYRKYLRPLIKKERETFTRIPFDLDLTPMKSPPQDADLLGKIRILMDQDRKRASSLFHPKEGEDSEADKISKGSVHYRYYPMDGKRCSGCSMFRPPSDCTLVRGAIDPNGYCDRWDKK